MRKNVTIGLSPAEFIRVQGAAAVAGMPIATYLKWLLRGGAPHDDTAKGIGSVLQRLDQIAVLIARLPRCYHASARPLETVTPPAAIETPPVSREAIERSLRERGMPSSTIRQLFVVLDEHGVLR
ncbi:MAG TPA: hypothetical protein VHP37_20570 [Burkholderiales bacterium]|nr:hypothetical protein [Burkholderiales bacterium]